MQTLYVRAQSKKAINEALARGDVAGDWHVMGDSGIATIGNMPDGTVIKVYRKMVFGQPYVHAYGTVARKKDGTVFLK